MNRDDLDPLIHAPKRLTAMAILMAAETMEFSRLRDRLEVSDSDLSKQMSALAVAGYVKVHKSGRGRNRSTSYTATRDGRRAFDRHVRALQAIVAGAVPDDDIRGGGVGVTHGEVADGAATTAPRDD